MQTRRNPFGFAMTELIWLGAAGWLLLTPEGQAVLNTLLPQPGRVGGARTGPGSGDGGRIELDLKKTRYTGQGVFGTIREGQQIDGVIGFRHIGPGGAYVVGLSIGYASPFCPVGPKGDPLQFSEANIEVPDDERWTSYAVNVGSPYIGVAPAVLDVQVYVRDKLGRMQSDLWFCKGLKAL